MARKTPNPALLKIAIEDLKAQLEKEKTENLTLLGANLVLDERLAEVEEENARLAAMLCGSAPVGRTLAADTGSGDVSALELAKVLGGRTPLTVSGSLRIMASLLPDRLIVLPDAWKSAEEADRVFRNTETLMGLLATLAIDYVDAVREGRNPNDVFTRGRLSVHESETTAGNEELSRARTFIDEKGRRITMTKHLKIGIASDRSLTLRIYFEWLPEENRVAIGYCGEHLPLKGRT